LFRSRAAVLAGAIVGGSLPLAALPAAGQECIDNWDKLLVKTTCDDNWYCDDLSCEMLDYSYTLTGFAADPAVAIWTGSGDPNVHTANPYIKYAVVNGVAPFEITTHSLKDLGTYTYWFEGEAAYSDGTVGPMISEYDDWTIVNAPPTAAPSVTGTMKVGNVLQFKSTASDPDHGTSGLHYEWSVASRPSADSTSTFSSATSASPTLDLADKHDIGNWSVTLKVADAEGELKEFPDLEFEVVNQPPTLDISGESDIDALEAIDLLATPDTDADGEEITWVWDLDASPHGAQAGYSTDSDIYYVTSPQDIGTWKFTCTAEDEHGATVSKSVSVEVHAIPPEIHIEGERDIDVGDVLHLETTILEDGYGDPLVSFEWTLLQVPVTAGEGLGVISNDPDVTIPTGAIHAGTWRLMLTVTDQVGDTAEEEVSVLVDALPTASISGPDQVASLSTPIDLDGSDSVDPDSPNTPPGYGHVSSDGQIEVSPGITVYEWSVKEVPPELYGDYFQGPVADVFGVSGSAAILHFPAGKLPVGNWLFELKAKDGEGNPDAENHWVQVLDESLPPTVRLSPPKTYTTDLAGVLSENVVVDGSGSFDLDNTLNEPEAPGLGITDYTWSLVTTPPTCTNPPSPPSGFFATTFTLGAAGFAVAGACQGVYGVGLTVTDDDTPTPKQATGTSIVRIGNCAGDVCIDYPTELAPEFVTFTNKTDVTIQYHLNSILYDDPAFAAGLRLHQQIFHEDDLVTPAFDKAWDVDLLPSDKGASLALHWSGFDNANQRPKPGKYTVTLQLVDGAGNPTGYAATEAHAVWIQVIDVAVANTSDRYLDREALVAGTDVLDVNYTVVGQMPGLTEFDQLLYRVRNASTNALVFTSSIDPPFTGAFKWTTEVGPGSFLPAGDYTVELELLDQGASLGKSPIYAFTVYEVKVLNPLDTDTDGNIDDAEEDNAGKGSEFTFWDPANRFRGSVAPNAAQLRVDGSATVTPAALGAQLRWRVFNGTDVSAAGVPYAPAGTVARWDGAAAPEGSGTSPKFTIDGLPASNDDFGRKTVRVQLLDPGTPAKVLKEIAVPVEVFWPLLVDLTGPREDANFAKSHNGADLNAINATDHAGQATRDATRAPNWMVFWGQVVQANDGIPADHLRYTDTLVDAFAVTPSVFYFDDGYIGRHDRLLIGESAQGEDPDPDGAAPREATNGIDAFRDTVIHENHHAIDESVGFSNASFGTAIDGSTLVTDAHWSFNLGKPASLPVPPLLGRVYNHFIDSIANGSFADAGEDLDLDGDDMPNASDPDPTGAFVGDVGNLALDSEPDKNHVLAPKDWGNPGKRHKTDDDPNN
jgi:hypothetical protein